jgi:hypothetical protein
VNDRSARRQITRKIILPGVLLGAISFGLFGVVQRVTAGSNPSPVALERSATLGDALPSAVASQLRTEGFDTSSSRHIGRKIYIVPKTGGLLCMVSIREGINGGCQPSSNFFNGSELIFGIADGGPGSTTIHVAGVAQANVAQVRITIGGSVTAVQTTSDGGFSVDVPVPSGTDNSTSLGTAEALDASGAALQSFTLPSG